MSSTPKTVSDDTEIDVENFKSKCVVSDSSNTTQDKLASKVKNTSPKTALEQIKYPEDDSETDSSPKVEETEKTEQQETPNEESTNNVSKQADALHPSSKKKENNAFRTVPKVNCKEKIIICLDMSNEMTEHPFKLCDGTQYSPLNMVKRTIEIFVNNKNIIDRRHEFALVALYETATWVKEFTTDPKDLIDTLEDLDETTVCNSCDLSSLFSLIGEKFDMKISEQALLIPPSFIYRVILIYGRSNCMPFFTPEYEVAKVLREYPYLFLDVLYIHESPSTENRCQEIFEALCDLDEKYKSYIFEVARNTTKLHSCMAKLLAHPLQRPAQKNAFYKLKMPEQQEVLVK